MCRIFSWNYIRISFLVLFVMAFVFTVFLGLKVYFTSQTKLLGNFSDNISYIQSHTDPDDFTFLAVGDVQGGIATFEHLLDASRGDHPAFAVIVGDFVSHPEYMRHKLFAKEISGQEIPFPVLLIPGNHDVSPDGPFRLEDFERFWGPAQFHFTFGMNLFIFLNNAPPYDEDGGYLNYFEKIVSHKSEKTSNIFVFMHVPPRGLNPEIKARSLYGSERFMELAKKYGVRHVFTGDHHGYVKTIKDETTYIVTGGGGAKLRGEHGRFHQMVRMEVKGNKVTETVIATDKKLETLYRLKQNIVVYIWPFITRNIYIIVLTMIILSAILIVFNNKRYKGEIIQKN